MDFVGNILRSIAPRSQQQDNDTTSVATPVEPITNDPTPIEEIAEVEMDLMQSESNSDDVSYPDMPSLADVSDSESELLSDDDSDRDANEVQFGVLPHSDHVDDEQTIPGLEPVDTPVSNFPRSNRRPRVDDDHDEERDRRHPSQRLGSGNNLANDNDNPNIPASQSQPPPSGPSNERPWHELFHQAMPGPGNGLDGGIGVSVMMDFGHGPVAVGPAPNDIGGQGLPPNVFGLPFNLGTFLGDLFGGPEQEDPERARILINGLEEVPVGLVKRLEQVGNVNSADNDGATGGDSACAICWDRLLDGEGNRFVQERHDQEAHSTETPNDQRPATSADASSSSQKKSSEIYPPKIVALPCAHVFHASCLVPWFSRPRQTTCPTCRFNIDPHNLTYVRRRRWPQPTANAASAPDATRPTTVTDPLEMGTAGNARPNTTPEDMTPAELIRRLQESMDLARQARETGESLEQSVDSLRTSIDNLRATSEALGNLVNGVAVPETSTNVGTAPSAAVFDENTQVPSTELNADQRSAEIDGLLRQAEAARDQLRTLQQRVAALEAANENDLNTVAASVVNSIIGAGIFSAMGAVAQARRQGQQGRQSGNMPQEGRPGLFAVHTGTSDTGAQPTLVQDFNAANNLSHPTAATVPSGPAAEPMGEQEEMLTFGFDVFVGEGPAGNAGEEEFVPAANQFHDTFVQLPDDRRQASQHVPVSVPPQEQEPTPQSGPQAHSTPRGAPQRPDTQGFMMALMESFSQSLANGVPGGATVIPLGPIRIHGRAPSRPSQAQADNQPSMTAPQSATPSLPNSTFAAGHQDRPSQSGPHISGQRNLDSEGNITILALGPSASAAPSSGTHGTLPTTTPIPPDDTEGTSSPVVFPRAGTAHVGLGGPFAPGGVFGAGSRRNVQFHPTTTMPPILPLGPSPASNRPPGSQGPQASVANHPSPPPSNGGPHAARFRGPFPIFHSNFTTVVPIRLRNVNGPSPTPPAVNIPEHNATTPTPSTGAARSDVSGDNPANPTEESAANADFFSMFSATLNQPGDSNDPQPAPFGGRPGPFRRFFSTGDRQPQPPRPRVQRKWTLPPPPGPTLRQCIEKKEREAGLRCYAPSCDHGPDDHYPIVVVSDPPLKQVHIRQSAKEREASSTTINDACPHTFHPSCLISAQRVALQGAEPSIHEDEVEVSCPVCRVDGFISQSEWGEGVHAFD